MKHTIGVIFLLVINAFELFSQNEGYGIYKTPQDYKERKLVCEITVGKIKTHEFLSGKYIDIIKDGKKYQFCKDSIFGYRDKNKNDYRFYKNHGREYKILESKTLTIYVADVPLYSSSGKYLKTIPSYFFSTSLDSEIIPLTLLNLKKAFPDNMKFHDMLDLEFGGGEPLCSYSTTDKMYKINLLINKSILK